MQREVRNLGRQGLVAMAISAVDIALWDLRAKLLDLSLADSLGRFREAIPAYGNGGFTSYGDAQLAEQLLDWVERGCRRVKIKVGREPEHDLHRLAVARKAIGADVELMVDANGAFDRRAAARWAEYGVSYFEEPALERRLDRDRAQHNLLDRARAASRSCGPRARQVSPRPIVGRRAACTS